MTNQACGKILQEIYPFLTTSDIEILLSIGHYRLCKNKEIIIPADSISRFTFFTLEGMTRGYFVNQKGEEKNIFLRPQHTMTGAPESLFKNLPTKYTFESILESHLWIIDVDHFKQAAMQHPNLLTLYLEGLQENILTLISRVEALIDKSPEERYEALLQQSPQFFQTAFNKHIANYLGITPVSLSRIVKRRKER